MSGETGNDTETSSTGNDVLLGESGDDDLSGRAGNDTINGDSGTDWCDPFTTDKQTTCKSRPSSSSRGWYQPGWSTQQSTSPRRLQTFAVAARVADDTGVGSGNSGSYVSGTVPRDRSRWSNAVR